MRPIALLGNKMLDAPDPLVTIGPMSLPKKARKRTALPKRKRPKTVERAITGAELFDGAAVVYQLERMRCGKAACKACRAGGAHGPYWRAYWTIGGRTRSVYIGRELRTVAQTLEQRREKRP